MPRILGIFAKNLALDATDIWFASVLTNGAVLTGGMLHRVPRAGGAVVDVVSLPEGTAAGGILFDGNSIYMPEGIRGAGEFMLAYEKSGGTVTYRFPEKFLYKAPTRQGHLEKIRTYALSRFEMNGA